MFDKPLIASGIVTALAIVYLWWLFHRGRVDGRWLVPVGLFYGVFALYVGWHFFNA
jgi:cation:H+ antiporter